MKPRKPLDAPGRYPPVSVWEACDAAGRRADELRDEGLELHFAVDEESASVVIELRTLDGEVLRKLPVREAIAIAEGGTPDADPPRADQPEGESPPT